MIPKIEYTVAELIRHIRNNPDPDVREIAAHMLYLMGKRDQLASSIVGRLDAATVQVA